MSPFSCHKKGTTKKKSQKLKGVTLNLSPNLSQGPGTITKLLTQRIL